jgi:hypothetical protein
MTTSRKIKARAALLLGAAFDAADDAPPVEGAPADGAPADGAGPEAVEVLLGEAADRVFVEGLPHHLRLRLPAPVQTPEGWWQVWGYGAKAGNVQVYPDLPVGLQRQYRPPEEVFDAASLASWLGRPVTILHPRDQGAQYTLLSPETARLHQDGSVFAAEADIEAQMVRLGVLITSAEGVAHVESPTGLRELSAGYLRALDPSPGLSPRGEPYDAIQRQIRVNHVALVPEGRAGKEARLRGATDSKEPQMEYEEITLPSGQVIKVARADASRVRDLVQANTDSAASVRSLTAETQALRAENATLKVDLGELRQKEERATADSLRGQLAPLLKGRALDGLSPEALRRAAVEAAYPDLAATFDAAQVERVYPKAINKLTEATQPDAAAHAKAALQEPATAPAADAAPRTDADRKAAATAARQKYLEEQANAWKRQAN